MSERIDRWTKTTAQWSSMPDHRDEADWDNVFGGRDTMLNELHQPHGTHDSAGARSRLDRIYVSSGVAEQLDAQMGCSTLDWCKMLSDHRPLIFFRKVGMQSASGKATLPEGPLKHPSWSLRVAHEFQYQMGAQGSPSCPLRQRAILKDSICHSLGLKNR